MARWQPAEREARYIKARHAGRPVVVSEGDSWFDYPMYLNIIDRVDDTKRFALKRLEFSGDTVANMAGKSGLASLKAVVTHERPRFVLFSGGGNDIVGEEFTDALKTYNENEPVEWHLQTENWRRLTEKVEERYVELIKEIGPLAPVFAHGYDYIIPANKPVKYDGISLAGPWVWKEMKNKGIPDDVKIKIARLMIDWFNGLLSDLEKKSSDNGYFAHLDLRETLARDLWENEIHPTESGFQKIAKRFISEMDTKIKSVLITYEQKKLGVK